MRYLHHSEAGHGHVNEDAVAVRPHPREAGLLLCVVADGQGGQGGGGEAARLVVQSAMDEAARRAPADLWQPAAWREILLGADAAVCADADAGFSTLIGLGACAGQVCGASCGDSAAWIVRANSRLDLTAEQRKNPPVGSGAAVPTAFVASLSEGDKLLVMSDGVWKYLADEALLSLVRTSDGADLASSLRELQGRNNGGKLPDDFSLALIF